MSITSWQFFALLAATTLLLRFAPAAARKTVLLAASVIFYASAGWASVAIIGFLIVANYWLLRATLGASTETARDRIYLAAILFNLTVFCALKLALEPAPGVAPTSWTLFGISIGYPLGLSFIILMLHSALTDAHSGKYEPDPNFCTFLLFSGFFPYVSAGPIERLHRMAGPLGTPARPGAGDLTEGLTLIALGLVKKIVTANHLKPYIDSVFDGDRVNSAPTLILAIALNAAYVYCDFSGYTDIARGAARCLGINISINFDRPFGARSITDFWRRWHISFSNWLRDYLFMPIAFTLRRQRSTGTAISLLVTFALCGFWHRAAWTFLVFGLLHGAAMVIELKWPILEPAPDRRVARLVYGLGAHLYTLVFLGATIVLFSAANLAQVARTLGAIPTSALRPSSTEFFAFKGPEMFVLMVIGLLLWQGLERWQRKLSGSSAPYFIAVCAMLLLFLGWPDGEGFVYAQF